MSGGPRRAGPRGPGRRALSEDDLDLWRRVTDSTRPLLKGAASRRALAASPEVPRPPRVESAAPPAAAPPILPDIAGPADASRPPAPPRIVRPHGRPEPPFRFEPPRDFRPRPVATPTPGLDRSTARKLQRGRTEPEARLDLHGMTADRAHGALSRFVAESWRLGRRCVLVVTGKGRGDGGARGEGVLRRDTPRWLEVPPLRDMVVGVYEAHPKHGGSGALYVYVKRRR